MADSWSGPSRSHWMPLGDAVDVQRIVRVGVTMTSTWRTGWLPWAALGLGAVASVAANVAVGGQDPLGKALAGWPALSLLVTLKLLFSMLEHTPLRPPATPPAHRRELDRPGRSPRRPPSPGPSPSRSWARAPRACLCRASGS